MMNPFQGYRITSQYGDRWGTKHRGIDLVKYHRAPIKSFTDGKVIFAGQTRTGTGLGNYGVAVVVQDDSPKSALHLYAHLDSVSVAVNEIVKIGTVIGRQGNTGHVVPAPTPANPTAGSHLHYEVRLKRSPSFGWQTDTEPTAYLKEYLKWKESEGKNRLIKKEDADKIISILQAHYKVVADLEGAKVANSLKEFGRLADEIRSASGQRAINVKSE